MGRFWRSREYVDAGGWTLASEVSVRAAAEFLLLSYATSRNKPPAVFSDVRLHSGPYCHPSYFYYSPRIFAIFGFRIAIATSRASHMYKGSFPSSTLFGNPRSYLKLERMMVYFINCQGKVL